MSQHDALHERLFEWSQWLWPQLANHLWQATLVVGCAALLVWCLRHGASLQTTFTMSGSFVASPIEKFGLGRVTIL